MTIGEKIRKERKKIGLTQEELGKQIGVSFKTVQRWETDERMPNVAFMPLLASALKTSINYLMGIGDFSEKKAPVEDNKKVVEEENTPNLAYWGGVIDNARLVAKSGDSESIFDVSQMLKRALASFDNVVTA